MVSKGRLIAFEGIDGGGKSGQIELLRSYFSDVVIFKYPTSYFSMLNDYLNKKISLDPKALFLLFLTDIANDQKNILAALNSGKTVILDRYCLSTIAYERGVFGFERSKSIVSSLDLLKPDLIVLFDIDAKTSHSRKNKQKILDRYEEDFIYLEKARSTFLLLLEERFLTPRWHKVDATKSIEAVAAEVKKLLS
ncbi:dTMP kinase [Candidatus Micrarchaeota archaeon]|nr:dTMP kinase [Candidatus Micrarchaeota archaeon]